jgi:hypothetical protein
MTLQRCAYAGGKPQEHKHENFAPRNGRGERGGRDLLSARLISCLAPPFALPLRGSSKSNKTKAGPESKKLHTHGPTGTIAGGPHNRTYLLRAFVLLPALLGC